MVPTHPPEGSQWRKQKLLLPALSESEQAAAGATGSSSQPGYAGLFQPARGRSSSGGSSSKSGGSRSSRGRTSSSMATASSAPSPTSSAAATVYGDETAEAAGSSSAVTGASSGSGSCNTVPSGMREVRYWHEITRSHWHNRLGNLVLLQPSGHEVRAMQAGYLLCTVGLQAGKSHHRCPDTQSVSHCSNSISL